MYREVDKNITYQVEIEFLWYIKTNVLKLVLKNLMYLGVDGRMKQKWTSEELMYLWTILGWPKGKFHFRSLLYYSDFRPLIAEGNHLVSHSDECSEHPMPGLHLHSQDY